MSAMQHMSTQLRQAMPPYWQVQRPELVNNIGSSWVPVLGPELAQPYFQKLCNFDAMERKNHAVYPSQADVFAWTRMCTVEQVEVIILGQDPYHKAGQATGLAFDVQPGTTIPRSLRNIFTELTNNGYPTHGYPRDWAEQGVLLLNSVLTVRGGKAGSHAGQGWEILTDAVVTYFNQRRDGIVFILLGKKAQAKGRHIDREKHCVIMAAHPSPLSANKGFFGINVFSQCNAYLAGRDPTPIVW